MTAAIKRKGLSVGSGLKAKCAGDWALVSSSEEGDTDMLLRRSGSSWEFYTGFPSNICRSKYLSDGGAPAYASRLSSC